MKKLIETVVVIIDIFLYGIYSLLVIIFSPFIALGLMIYRSKETIKRGLLKPIFLHEDTEVNKDE